VVVRIRLLQAGPAAALGSDLPTLCFGFATV